jgi:integrase
VHCTPDEREEIIAMAEEAGWEDWIAIPLAFYSGMRREEVANLEWPDVRFPEGKIIVGKSKTKRGREIPLNAKLESLLSSLPASGRSGYVVKMPGKIDRLFRMDNFVRHIRRMKRDQFLATNSIEKPPPSRSKDYTRLLLKPSPDDGSTRSYETVMPGFRRGLMCFAARYPPCRLRDRW